jgi:pimeloyl-ACP methyl ester carboxylesterase
MRAQSHLAVLVGTAALITLMGGGAADAATTSAAGATAPPPTAAAYGSNPGAGASFVAGGTRFYFESYGAGAPMLLIHGNGQSIESFKEQIGEFAIHHRVIAMDSRGQGKSQLGTAPLTDKVGMLAVMGANIQPDGAYPWAVEGIARMRKRIEAQLPGAKNPEALQFQLQLLDLLGNQPHIPLSDLAKIQIPTLIMAGDRDVIRDEHTLSLFHAIQKSQLAIFPAATHMIPEEDPARFNKTVLDFFDKPFAMPDSKDLGWFD